MRGQTIAWRQWLESASSRRLTKALWVSKMSFHIHTIVKNSNHNNFGFDTLSEEYNMAALAKFSVTGLYVSSIPANLWLASKKFESTVQLLQVFIALLFPPSFSGKPANFYDVFPSRSSEQKWAH